MTQRANALVNACKRRLSPYNPDTDGPMIDVRVLPRAMGTTMAPWLARLIGEGASAGQVTKITPLLGRIWMGTRPVVLAHSFAAWVAHQNPHMDGAACQALTDDLVAETKRLHDYWKGVRKERTLAGKLDVSGMKPKPRKEKAPPKARISTDVFSAWR